MSYTDEPRVKQIRQYTGNTNKHGQKIYSDGVPIGADGKYIDMSSTLDLEQELKLGGNHYVHIDDVPKSGGTTITEWYCNQSIGWKSIEDVENKESIVDYTVKTHFHYAYEIEQLENEQENEENKPDLTGILFLTNTDSAPYLAGNGVSSVTNYTLIITDIFKGYQPVFKPIPVTNNIPIQNENKPIHQKISLIGENTYIDKGQDSEITDDDVYHELTSVWEDLDINVPHKDIPQNINTGGNG